MDKLKPPHELKIAGGNLADRWERFLERFRWYLAAVGEDGSEDNKKVAILLTVAGAEAHEVFRTFTYEPAKAAVGNQPAVPAETAEQFSTESSPSSARREQNVINERYVFHTRVQSEGETIDSFTTDLRLKSQSCEFGSLQDSLIRDRVVVGIRNSKIRGKVTQRLRANVRAGNRHLQSKRSRASANESVNWRRKQCKCEHDSNTEKNEPQKKQVPVEEQETP